MLTNKHAHTNTDSHLQTHAHTCTNDHKHTGTHRHAQARTCTQTHEHTHTHTHPKKEKQVSGCWVWGQTAALSPTEAEVGFLLGFLSAKPGCLPVPFTSFGAKCIKPPSAFARAHCTFRSQVPWPHRRSNFASCRSS